MTNDEINRTIAEKIANDLFTNGVGEEAKRLVLVLPDGRDIGGWCKQAVVDRISSTLAKFQKEREK